MIGKKFGRLVVQKEGVKNGRRLVYACLCECGRSVSVLGESLRSGNTKSCGCLNVEIVKGLFTTHGMCKTKTYYTWIDMIQRCTNPNNSRYSDYGGRGITVCKRWLKFDKFYKDMGEKPAGLTIERIDNESGYFKENCEYITYSEQARNRRIKSSNTSGITGVSLNKQRKKYQAYICTDQKQINLGFFSTLKQAAEARRKAEQKYWNIL